MDEEFSGSSAETFRRLEQYVKEQLQASGVIPEDEANPANPEGIAARIVYNAWSQPQTKYYADLYIREAIKFPPEPISDKRFSLKAFVQIVK